MKIDALSLSLKASVTVIAKHLPETGCPECLSLFSKRVFIAPHHIPRKSRLFPKFIPLMGECEIEPVNDHGVNATTKMSPSYDLIIEENGLFKTIEVWAANKEGAVSEWRGKKGEIRGVVFNEKNYKDEPGLNLL